MGIVIDGAYAAALFAMKQEAKPSLVEATYGQLLEKYSNQPEIQVAIAGRVIKALHPNAPISQDIEENFISNKNLITEHMEKADELLLSFIVDNFTKDTTSHKKEDYQDVLHGVHINNASVRCFFDTKIWNNKLN